LKCSKPMLLNVCGPSPLPHHASCSYFEMLGGRRKLILQIGGDDHNIL
jgi:hypothetical protein